VVRALGLSTLGYPSVDVLRAYRGDQLPRRYLPRLSIAATIRELLMTIETTFAARLRWWRTHRGFSQLALAGRANISQRHLSFLELGRASPSREMVDRLATALDIPLRQHNALLLAAGYAPEWHQRDLAAPDLAEVASALDYMLAQQEPYPAVVVDRHWNLLKGNAGSVRLVEFLVGPIAPGTPINLADALVAPNVLRPYLTNWTDVVRHFIRSVEADAAADGLIETTALLDRLMGYEGVRSALMSLAPRKADNGPVLAMHFRKRDASLRLFTTIATLGTPQDITLQELRIESFFPMDDTTAELLRSWANAPRQRRSERGSPRDV
jgi:transcriptional regulator with XRE-family HTH domain